jgi:tetratricopeptide (TPR) repeat protein
MKLRNLFGKKDNSKHPATDMSPLLRAMVAEIPRWPPHRRPLMERIVIEANAAGVSSMEEFSKFLDSRPDLQAGYYATMSERFGPGGSQLPPTLETFEEPSMSVTSGNATQVIIDGETMELSAEGFATHPEMSIKVNTTLLEQIRTRGDRYGEAVVLGELGLAHARSNQLQKAIYYFERHLEIARELGNWEWEMADYRNLGRAYVELSDYEHAGPIYEKAVERARKRKDRRWDIEHSLYLASVYAGQGKIELAAELRNHAMALRNRGAI